ncbi:MAG: hypothetical protein LBN20_06465 [Endomicrobium sp.]|jgi:hypothetical protein|nr:hypothetical protein [Endomicrobium sp.]
MATSSIESEFVIKDAIAAKRLIAAMEYADKHPSKIKPYTTNIAIICINFINRKMI